jgi:hypothetical protein
VSHLDALRGEILASVDPDICAKRFMRPKHHIRGTREFLHYHAGKVSHFPRTWSMSGFLRTFADDLPSLLRTGEIKARAARRIGEQAEFDQRDDVWSVVQDIKARTKRPYSSFVLEVFLVLDRVYYQVLDYVLYEEYVALLAARYRQIRREEEKTTRSLRAKLARLGVPVDAMEAGRLTVLDLVNGAWDSVDAYRDLTAAPPIDLDLLQVACQYGLVGGVTRYRLESRGLKDGREFEYVDSRKGPDARDGARRLRTGKLNRLPCFVSAMQDLDSRFAARGISPVDCSRIIDRLFVAFFRHWYFLIPSPRRVEKRLQRRSD